eukprot:Rmarinus@m.12783
MEQSRIGTCVQWMVVVEGPEAISATFRAACASKVAACDCCGGFWCLARYFVALQVPTHCNRTRPLQVAKPTNRLHVQFLARVGCARAFSTNCNGTCGIALAEPAPYWGV